MTMPVPELMTWVPAQRRWTKMYRGRRHYISVRQLGIVPETKEASLAAANQWWRDKQAELDYAARAAARVPQPMEDLAAAAMGVEPDLWGNMRQLLEAALRREQAHKPRPSAVPPVVVDALRDAEAGRRPSPPPGAVPTFDQGDGVDHEIDEPEPADVVRRREVMNLLEQLLFGDSPTLPHAVANQLPLARAQQVEDAAKAIRGEQPAAPRRTVHGEIEAWLKAKQSQAAGGALAPRTLHARRVQIAHATSIFGEDTDPATIDADKLDLAYNFCLSKIAERRHDSRAGWSTKYAIDVFQTLRVWVRWLWKKGIIASMPRNLDDRFAFGSPIKAIRTWTVDDVREVFAAKMSPTLRLAMLLQLNCGMQQKDVADLRDDEVDWKQGRIRRKRSKTKDCEGTPTVDYLLWPVAFALLRDHRSKRDLVLLTKTGKPFYRTTAKGSVSDIFGSMYADFQKGIGFRKPMKSLRKTSASLLEGHPIYGRLTSLFLGHAPATMKEKHYAAPPQALFDEAVTWLGRQLGFVETPQDTAAKDG
jgi:integrase